MFLLLLPRIYLNGPTAFKLRTDVPNVFFISVSGTYSKSSSCPLSRTMPYGVIVVCVSDSLFASSIVWRLLSYFKSLDRIIFFNSASSLNIWASFLKYSSSISWPLNSDLVSLDTCLWIYDNLCLEAFYKFQSLLIPRLSSILLPSEPSFWQHILTPIWLFNIYMFLI